MIDCAYLQETNLLPADWHLASADAVQTGLKFFAHFLVLVWCVQRHYAK
jgi:hypothetical protein